MSTMRTTRCAPPPVGDGVFLETPRLVLRDKTPDDFDFVASLYADENVMRWIGDGRTLGRGEVEARFFRVLEIEREPGHERWDAFKIVVRKTDGARVGQAGMLRCAIDGAPEIEIGWWLAPLAWGRGYATEAARALCDFAFAELRLDHLSIVLQAENMRSVAVARRIGGIHAGEAVYRERSVTRYVVPNPAAQPPPAVR
jgi:RimJ/RimL family protein N-acetyltransferase